MEQIPRETSCYSTSLLIKYAIERGFDQKILFEGIEGRKELLENPREWIDYATCICLVRNFEKSGGDPFKAGEEITINQVSNFQMVFLKIASLSVIINSYSKQFEKTISPLQLLSKVCNNKEI